MVAISNLQHIQIGLLERCDPLDVATFHRRVGIVESWMFEFKSLAFHGWYLRIMSILIYIVGIFDIFF